MRSTILLVLMACLCLVGCEGCVSERNPSRRWAVVVYRGESAVNRYTTTEIFVESGYAHFINDETGREVYVSGTFTVEGVP